MTFHHSNMTTSTTTTTTTPHQQQRQHKDESRSTTPISDHLTPTGLSYAMAFFILGASAGMTMYTRSSGQMLSRIEQYTANQLKRNPPKFGPPTRAEFEKMKNRW
mmetsp:Transcript_7820/g.15651  ORF Transcript_7820/g.15651 Transcript_7820/m.15651 type:complete len:105 (+) Transcript_7820:182-496(+)